MVSARDERTATMKQWWNDTDIGITKDWVLPRSEWVPFVSTRIFWSPTQNSKKNLKHNFYNRFRHNDYIQYILWHEDQLLHMFAVVLYSVAQECCKYLYLPQIQIVYGKILRLALWLLWWEPSCSVHETSLAFLVSLLLPSQSHAPKKTQEHQSNLIYSILQGRIIQSSDYWLPYILRFSWFSSPAP